jgi:hypothetical protein
MAAAHWMRSSKGASSQRLTHSAHFDVTCQAQRNKCTSAACQDTYHRLTMQARRIVLDHCSQIFDWYSPSSSAREAQALLAAAMSAGELNTGGRKGRPDGPQIVSNARTQPNLYSSQHVKSDGWRGDVNQRWHCDLRHATDAMTDSDPTGRSRVRFDRRVQPRRANCRSAPTTPN